MSFQVVFDDGVIVIQNIYSTAVEENYLMNSRKTSYDQFQGFYKIPSLGKQIKMFRETNKDVQVNK